jgi:hypothetical protein
VAKAKKPNRLYKENDGNKYAHNPNFAAQVIKSGEAHNSYGQQQELMIKDR